MFKIAIWVGVILCIILVSIFIVWLLMGGERRCRQGVIHYRQVWVYVGKTLLPINEYSDNQGKCSL